MSVKEDGKEACWDKSKVTYQDEECNEDPGPDEELK
jgi:hypothetical protein